MTNKLPDWWSRPCGNCAEILKRMVQHRGLAAEAELIDVLTLERLMALYEGAEPSFGELLECARVLGIPLATFQVHERGSFREIELAYSELLYNVARLPREERERVAEALSALAASFGEQQREKTRRKSDGELPETLISILRRPPQ